MISDISCYRNVTNGGTRIAEKWWLIWLHFGGAGGKAFSTGDVTPSDISELDTILYFDPSLYKSKFMDSSVSSSQLEKKVWLFQIQHILTCKYELIIFILKHFCIKNDLNAKSCLSSSVYTPFPSTVGIDYPWMNYIPTSPQPSSA